MSTRTLRFIQQENARLKDENETLRQENLGLRRYMDALKELYRAMQQIISQENLLGLLDQILYHAMSVLRAEGGSLLVYDDETNELVFVLVQGDAKEKLQGYRIKRGKGIAGWIATQQQPLIVNNARQDRRFSVEVDEKFNFTTRSIVGVPMVTRDKLIGVIEVINKQGGDPFNEFDADLLAILGHVAAIALDELHARLEAEEAAAKGLRVTA
ncbi:MAG TPA: GAF domain-containing protein [Anaerolineae bacterium]|jgi:GAF domain-containing protein